MKRDDVHRSWTPTDDPWSPWVKPVLFASLAEVVEPTPLREAMPWIRTQVVEPLGVEALPADPAHAHPYRADSRARDTAIIVDLASSASVRVGIALIDHGWRPVPLYNAVPSLLAVVDLAPIMSGLVDGAERISAVVPGSPPAFIVDADRLSGARHLRPGAFDNRSVCRESDFPSAETLWRAGIRRALWIHANGDRPAGDLEPVLLAWQQRGIALFRKRFDDAEAALPFRHQRRSWPARAMAALRRSLLPRRDDDTYGMIVPQSSGG